MRKIILVSSISLDGFMEGPDHDISWHQVDQEVHEHVNTFLAEVGAFIYGRVTHELMADFWPTADEDPQASPEIKSFARIWREKPKIVYSRTLKSAGWNTTIVPEIVPDEVRALKAQPGADLEVGGAQVSQAFLAHDLIDELHIYVHPVLVGGGTPLFPAGGRQVPLELIETRRFGNGVVSCTTGARRVDDAGHTRYAYAVSIYADTRRGSSHVDPDGAVGAARRAAALRLPAQGRLRGADRRDLAAERRPGLYDALQAGARRAGRGRAR